MTTGLVFHPEPHRYERDGLVLPHITGVLGEFGILSVDGIPPEVLERARQRGLAVHLGIRYLSEGRLNWATVDPVIEPYLVAYLQFCEDTGFRPEVIERPLDHPVLGFAGMPDCAGPWNGEPAVIDIKSGILSRGVGVQLAAQKLLLDANGYPVRARFALRVKPDSKYHLEPYRDRHDEAEFRAALFLYQRRNGGRP